MKEYQSLLKDIKNKETLPIYFLQGEEAFFIDKITEALEENVLSEEEKGFNMHILYGLETTIEEVMNVAKQYPFGGEKQLVIVKEAQHINLSKSEAARDLLEEYVHQPQPQTVLVFNYKNKSLNGNLKLSKALKKNKYRFDSERLKYEEQFAPWIQQHAQSLKINLNNDSAQLLATHLGGDRSTIDNQLQKIKMIAGKDEVTPHFIEEHIGISKDFNNFELSKAIALKNIPKAFSIVQHFESNPKKYPLVLSVATIYSLFTKVIISHAYGNISDKELASNLRVSEYYKILNDYKVAKRNYSLKDATRALENLQDIDLKSKGLGANMTASPSLLREFLYKTFAIKN